MRKIIYSTIASLDGFEANDSFEPTPDEHAAFNDLLAASDAIIFDRPNHDLLVPFWDDVDLESGDLHDVERDFARIFRTKQRFVVTEEPIELEPQASAIDGDLIATISALREEPGNQLFLAAGVDLFNDLLAAGLIDEIEVVLRPLISSGGQPAFAGSTGLLLQNVRALDSGSLVIRYTVQR